MPRFGYARFLLAKTPKKTLSLFCTARGLVLLVDESFHAMNPQVIYDDFIPC
jgi:hypothetical protein